MRPGDTRPVIQLTVREQLTFMRLVHAETRRAGRRLVDIWARPEDAHPHAERLLGETLRMMWRTAPE